MANKSYLESFETEKGTEYYFRDADAQSDITNIKSDVTTAQGNISTLQSDVSTAKTDITGIKSDISDIKSAATGAMHYAGATTTALTDGATTATLSVDGATKTFTAADSGAVVIYGELEFVWSGTKWKEFGSTGSLKALAFKENASANYQPEGDVSKPSFVGTEKSVSVSGTPTGSITATTNTSGNYQPKGMINTPTISVKTQGDTTTVNSITDVGTLPTMSTEVVGTKLKINFSQGTLPTKGADQTVKTTDAAYQASALSFTGEKVQLAFDGNNLTSTGTFKPEGDVSKPSFDGASATITVQ